MIAARNALYTLDETSRAGGNTNGLAVPIMTERNRALGAVHSLTEFPPDYLGGLLNEMDDALGVAETRQLPAAVLEDWGAYDEAVEVLEDATMKASDGFWAAGLDCSAVVNVP